MIIYNYKIKSIKSTTGQRGLRGRERMVVVLCRPLKLRTGHWGTVKLRIGHIGGYRSEDREVWIK
jgi:hypothetical protein